MQMAQIESVKNAIINKRSLKIHGFPGIFNDLLFLSCGFSQPYLLWECYSTTTTKVALSGAHS